ncbi:hypothetical protein FQR65_LT02277 [Abscondita terminalis]|nr:hypothetical protein FQR65_LT02277 [Abscondita terminalis]
MDESILHSRNPQDITNPKIINVDGYCIRDFQCFQTEQNSPNKSMTLAPYEEYDELVDCNEIEDNVNLDISDTGKFVLKFHVPSCFVGYIIGTKGTVRNKIEQDTRTTINVIKEDVNNVRITARDKHRLTHFISIPLVTDLIKYNFDSFKTSILSDATAINGLHPSMFQNPSKIHLTIAPLVLADNVEEMEAVTLLKECNTQVIKPLFANVEKLKVTLNGVEIMNDDPTNVDVLYGKIQIEPPKYNELLQKMADGIYNYFTNKGLVRKQFENVKLHATLINSLFRKTDKNEKPPRRTFDATHILKKYKNYHFGDADLKFVHLSIRFTKSDNSYYDALTTVSIK